MISGVQVTADRHCPAPAAPPTHMLMCDPEDVECGESEGWSSVLLVPIGDVPPPGSGVSVREAATGAVAVPVSEDQAEWDAGADDALRRAGVFRVGVWRTAGPSPVIMAPAVQL